MVMLQVHPALWSVLHTHKKHPGSPTLGAGSGVSLPSHFPSRTEDAVGDQADDGGMQEVQGEENKPLLW